MGNKYYLLKTIERITQNIMNRIFYQICGSCLKQQEQLVKSKSLTKPNIGDDV